MHLRVMKKIFIHIVIAFAFIPFGMLSASSRDLGEPLFTLDVEQITGDARCMGVEFDGNHYWVTGAYDFTKCYLYEISPGGTLVNKYEQPPANWGGWGWHDLAYDGTYLYAGDPNGGYIDQIDPADGSLTGIRYGPFPLVPCRALAYDPSTDSFWTASFTSSIYQCFKDGTYHVYTNPGFLVYAAAVEDYDQTDPNVWFCVVDSVGAVAVNITTGQSFTLGDGPGGACAFDMGHGAWALVVLHQSMPDLLTGYDLDTLDGSLEISPNMIQADQGGHLSFALNAGTVNAKRYYVIFTSLSGHSPGTLLPGGQVTLPLNWDLLTSLVLAWNPPGFSGTLDDNGEAGFMLWVTPMTLPGDMTLTFAYALAGPPWDFASIHREVLLDVP